MEVEIIFRTADNATLDCFTDIRNLHNEVVYFRTPRSMIIDPDLWLLSDVFEGNT